MPPGIPCPFDELVVLVTAEKLLAFTLAEFEMLYDATFDKAAIFLTLATLVVYVTICGRVVVELVELEVELSVVELEEALLCIALKAASRFVDKVTVDPTEFAAVVADCKAAF
jgi:hypothetical protein